MHCKQEIDIFKISFMRRTKFEKQKGTNRGEAEAKLRHFCKNGIALFRDA
jgi:hypothetical protein